MNKIEFSPCNLAEEIRVILNIPMGFSFLFPRIESFLKENYNTFFPYEITKSKNYDKNNNCPLYIVESKFYDNIKLILIKLIKNKEI